MAITKTALIPLADEMLTQGAGMLRNSVEDDEYEKIHADTEGARALILALLEATPAETLKKLAADVGMTRIHFGYERTPAEMVRRMASR